MLRWVAYLHNILCKFRFSVNYILIGMLNCICTSMLFLRGWPILMRFCKKLTVLSFLVEIWALIFHQKRSVSYWNSFCRLKHFLSCSLVRINKVIVCLTSFIYFHKYSRCLCRDYKYNMLHILKTLKSLSLSILIMPRFI